MFRIQSAAPQFSIKGEGKLKFLIKDCPKVKYLDVNYTYKVML